jgi:hypothetical protein
MRSLFPVAVALLVLFALPGAFVFAADLLGYGVDLNTWLETRLGVSHRLAVSLPAAVVLFCVPPVIILLYFLRLRRKPVPVSSTFLWHKSIEDLHVNRLMQWLRRNLLLLLQLLAVLLAIYAVLGPRLHAALGEGRHYVLIIDNSASMSATDVQPSRLEWAKAEAIKEIEAATDADSGMVIVFNRTAEIRQSYTTNRAVLRRAVESIQPTVAQTRFDEALNLAASLANPARSTENEVARPEAAEPGKERQYVPLEGMQADVHLYSDGVFPPVPGFALANLNLNYHAPPVPPAAGGVSHNVGLVRLDAHRDDPGRLVVTASVRNYRGSPVPDQLVRVEVLDADDRVTGAYSQRVRLEPKADQPAGGLEVPFVLPDVPENADVVVRARLESTGDAFPLDDVAWLVPGVARKARVLVFAPDNTVEQSFPGPRRFLDLPSTQRIADVTRYTPDRIADKKVYDKAREGEYDLVIFDRCAPPTEDDMPRGNTFFIGHPPPPFKLKGSADDKLVVKPERSPRVTGWVGSHPVMRRLQGLYEVEIDDAFRIPELPPRTERLIESDANLVLLAAVPRPPFTDLVLAFPVYTEDGLYNTLWPLRPSFVVFLRNVMRSLGNVRDALAEDVTRPGDIKVLRAAGSRQKMKVTLPTGRTEDLDRAARADFAFAGTSELGVYTAVAGDDRQRFAVNLFDPAEGDIAPRESVSVGSQTVEAGKPRKQPRDLWKLAVLAGVVVLLAEWWIYNKRVQI